MTAITVDRLTHRLFLRYCWISLSSAAGSVLPLPLLAQQVEVAPSSGVVGELPAGSDADHKRLMRVRAEAQQARREAQLAALQRSATTSTDQSNRDKVLQKARQDKEFKRRAALAVQQQQAVNAYQKVKQSEIDSWQGRGGGKIKPGVPADFTASLPPLEEDSEKSGGLLSGVVNAPGKALKGLSSLRPSFLGGKKKDNTPAAPAAQFAPPETLALDAVAPRRPEPSAETGGGMAEPREERGFRIPLVSKLTGGKKEDADPYVGGGEPDTPRQQESAPLEEDPPPGREKGFFEGIASAIPLVGNKKEDVEDNPYYYEATDEAVIAEDESKSGFLSKLSLKKDRDTDPGQGGGDPAGKQNIYIVDSEEAQFFPFGKSGRRAGSQPLAEGTIVRMTKSGDDWSSIELSSGSMGVMRNKSLRRAKADEVPANMFAHKPKAPFPTTARITKARSATGNSAPHRYREPVNVPLPDLPAGGGESGIPIGNGLLPPLAEEGAIQ